MEKAQQAAANLNTKTSVKRLQRALMLKPLWVVLAGLPQLSVTPISAVQIKRVGCRYSTVQRTTARSNWRIYMPIVVFRSIYVGDTPALGGSLMTATKCLSLKNWHRAIGSGTSELQRRFLKYSKYPSDAIISSTSKFRHFILLRVAHFMAASL